MVVNSKNDAVGIPKKVGRKNNPNKKIGLKIYLHPDFFNELDKITNFLFRAQPERKILFKRLIPYPYSMGDELEFRFKEFITITNLCLELIETLPEEKQDQYLERLHESPLIILKTKMKEIEKIEKQINEL